MTSLCLSKRCFQGCCILWLCALVLHAPSCGFARPKQTPLSELRERTGLAIRAKAPPIEVELLPEEKKLISKIRIAGEKRHWTTAQKILGSYAGDASPIYGAAMLAAFRCRKFKEGAEIYNQCNTNCKYISPVVYTVALRIYSKLGDVAQVDQIWEDAMKEHELDEIFGSARIVAAAEAGNVELAAETLDMMQGRNVTINVYHINAAMRACKGWGDQQHKAAKYFFDLLPILKLSPTVVSFTSLMAAYKTASLDDILSAYNEMKALQIEPDAVFAETYMFTLLQSGERSHMRLDENLDQAPTERLQAARDALADFQALELHLHQSCVAVDKALSRMGL